MTAEHILTTQLRPGLTGLVLIEVLFTKSREDSPEAEQVFNNLLTIIGPECLTGDNKKGASSKEVRTGMDARHENLINKNLELNPMIYLKTLRHVKIILTDINILR